MSNRVKKVGVLTLNGYNNYGNRLQNYALEETIKNLGCKPQTIIVNRKTKVKEEKLTDKLKQVSSISELFFKANNKLHNKKNRKHVLNREKNFINFSKKYINETSYAISKDSIPENLSDQYDYFITGSDQVWNPNNLHGTTFFFLTFADKNKRVAYAPSFGISKIKSEIIDRYRGWLSEIPYLSVREEDGAMIIKELINENAPVLIDPTLLLSKERWLSIAEEAKNKPKGRYLLTYFLGDVPMEYKKQIKKFSKAEKLKIVNLYDIKDKRTYEAGPGEFIDYVNSCSIFCTDSFHGCVFSILFKKPFIAYKRKGLSSSMESRINTLLDKFDFNFRKYENIKGSKNVFSIDYTEVSHILETERNKSINYLKEALEIEE